MVEYTFKPDLSKTQKKPKNADLDMQEIEHDSKPISSYVEENENTNLTNLRNSQDYVAERDEQLKTRFAPKH